MSNEWGFFNRAIMASCSKISKCPFICARKKWPTDKSK